MRPIPDNHTFVMRVRVTAEMTARFFDCEIHPLYATFALVEHAEYASRCAILPWLEPGEDAVGFSLEVEHRAPTRVGEVATIEATVVHAEGRRIVCEFTARNSRGEIASGRTTQAVVPKERMKGF